MMNTEYKYADDTCECNHKRETHGHIDEICYRRIPSGYRAFVLCGCFKFKEKINKPLDFVKILEGKKKSFPK